MHILIDNNNITIQTITNSLTIIFYCATAIVLLERMFALGFTISKTAPMKTAWTSYEYTLALLLPLAGFAYFCSSKYAKNVKYVKNMLNMSKLC